MSQFVRPAAICLGPPPAGLQESPMSSSGLTMTPRSDIVQFGKVYWTLVGNALGTVGATAKGKSKSKKAVVDEGASSIPDELIKIPLNVTPKNLRKFSLYDLLGLGEHSGSADENAIRKAYHKCVLIYHPDKKQNKRADGAEDNTVWLKIQEAFSTLLDTKKRRAYDSQLPFDESVPSEGEVEAALAAGGEAFYELFDKVFKRNSRFAEIKPVPEVGNTTTAIKEVDKFYAYWINFESWRDFTGIGAEYRPDEASSREEKRFMIKENEKLAVKLKKKEIVRITDMVIRAMNKDPRIIADKLAQKTFKESAVKAKEEAAASAAATAAQREQETKELAAFTKAEKEKARKKASAARNSFRKLLRAIAEYNKEEGEFGNVPADDVELMLTNCSTDDVMQLVDAMGGETAIKDTDLLCVTGAAAVQETIRSMKEEQMAGKKSDGSYDPLREERIRAAVEKSVEPSTRSWSRDELSSLAKAVGKFPAGVGQRWLAVCNSMNELLKPASPFTEQECMKAAHDAVKSASKMSTEVAGGASKDAGWTQSQQKLLEDGLKKFPMTMEVTDRWDSISEGVTGKSRKECIDRYKALCDDKKPKK